MIRTRHLPGDAVIAFHRTLGLTVGRVPHAHEVDHGCSGRYPLDQCLRFLARGGDDQHIGVIEKQFRAIHHEPANMGNMVQDVFAISSHEARKPYVPVVDQKFVSLTDELLRQGDDRTLAQVVRAFLETQSE